MPLHRLMPVLIAMLVASVAGMVLGGATHRVWTVILSAATFSAMAIGVAVVSNAPYWQARRARGADAAAIALQRNARLMAVAYAWGAIAMQSLYTTSLTGLKWQHGWQYALLMLLFALASFRFARGLDDPSPERRAPWLALALPLAIANALLSAGGLAILAASGKLLLRRSDWAANQVFLFGALTIMVLAAITLRTHAVLTRE